MTVDVFRRTRSVSKLCCLFLVVALAAVCLPATTVAQDEYLVTLSRMDELVEGRDQPAVILEWKVFRRSPGQVEFREYIPGTLPGFLLSVNGKEIQVDSTRYILEDVEIGRQYDITVQFARAADINNVTAEINAEQGMEYNSGDFELRRVQVAPDPPLFIQWIALAGRQLYGSFQQFLRQGSVLYISYILTGVFLVGVLGALFHAYRLFLVPEHRPRYIRRQSLRVMHTENAGEAVQDIRGPARRLVREFIRKVQMYGGVKLTHDLTEQDFSRVGKVERSVTDRINSEVTDLSGMGFTGIGGRGGTFFSFFFSIEFFWNLGVIAPMLGLLGTVTGISKAFGTVSVLSSLNSLKEILESLSGGINEALFTTIGGLFVGVLFVGLYYLFSWRLDKIRKSMDHVLDVLMKNL